MGAAIPILALVLYNVLTTGQVFHPAYDHLYRLETAGYPSLGYHADWGAEDPRYLPQNLGIALFGTPVLAPSTLPESISAHPTPVCVDPSDERGLFDVACPLAVPRDTGMSVILTSPAYLLAIPVLRRYGRSRLVTGAVLAVGFIALRQPDALLAGLGPVRLPVQQRRGAVRVDPGRARVRAAVGPLPMGHARGHDPRRRCRSPSTCGASCGAGCWHGEETATGRLVLVGLIALGPAR